MCTTWRIYGWHPQVTLLEEVSRVKIDGARCNSQVVVKCSLLNSDEEEAEVLELPSGCVRFLAASRAIGLFHSPFAGRQFLCSFLRWQDRQHFRKGVGCCYVIFDDLKLSKVVPWFWQFDMFWFHRLEIISAIQGYAGRLSTTWGMQMLTGFTGFLFCSFPWFHDQHMTHQEKRKSLVLSFVTSCSHHAQLCQVEMCFTREFH